MVDALARLGEPGGDPELFDRPGGGFIRVSSLVAALRRRRRVWIVTAVVGLLAASAFFKLRGPQFGAATTVLIRRSSINAQDPSSAMSTDIELAESRTVAGRALSQLQLAEPVAAFQAGYKVSSLSNDILVVSAKSSTPAGAVTLANIVANTFVTYLDQTVQREAQVQISALQQQSNLLQGRVGPLDQQIDAATVEVGSAAQSTTSVTLGNLLAQRSQIEDQIQNFQQQIDNLTVDTVSVVQNTRVIDPALAGGRAVKKALELDLPIGLLGGAGLGAGWVVFFEAVSTRVRRRQDVMNAMDAPVAVSVGRLEARKPFRLPGSPPRVTISRRSRRELAKVARYLRSVLSTSDSPAPALAVVSVATDEVAAQATKVLVQRVVGEGNDVLAVDLTARSALARSLGTTPGTVAEASQAGSDARLWVVSRSPAEGDSVDDWLQLHNLADEAEAVVVLTALDPAEGAGYLSALATTAVVVVTSGRSTAETLRATSQMVRAAGLALRAAVLVDTDPSDESFGVPVPVASPPVRRLTPA